MIITPIVITSIRLFTSSTVSVCAIMSLLTFVVVLIIVFFNTRYKRLEAELAQSNTNISTTSGTPPSSGYASENASKEGTTSSRTPTKKISVLSAEEQVDKNYLEPVKTTYL